VARPAPDHPGTERLYTDGRFATASGRAHFIAVEHDPPVEPPDGDYPLTLTTGRVRDHWHTLTRTGKSPALMRRTPEPLLEVNLHDARRAGVRDGDFVEITSRRGKAVAQTRVSERIREGTCFLALPLGARPRLLQGRQQPDAGRAGSAVQAAGAQVLRRPPPPITPITPISRGTPMNRIEALKAEKDGLDVLDDLVRFAREGWKTIADDDKERLKWAGVFHRRPTPGHFMMRVRMPNGIVTAAQVRLLGEITKESGRNVADVTTRQQVQLRWLGIEGVPEVIARLEAAGLTTLQTGMDNIRGIIGCPATGLTPKELLDTAEIAREFQRIFVGNKEFTNLPRKFNVTITGCPEHCTSGETQDVSMTPAIASLEGEEVVGFNLAVGGKQGSGGPVFATPLDAFVRPGEAAEVSAAVALIFRDHGPREARSKSRLAFLIAEWGGERFRKELEVRLGRPLPPAGRDARGESTNDHIGVFRQRQPGLNYVGLKTPVGRVSGDQLLELARLAESYGQGELRFTPSQNVLIPHIPRRARRRPDAGAAAQGAALQPARGRARARLVHGHGFLQPGPDRHEDARDGARPRALAEGGGIRPLTIRWSGCPASCGNHHTADIGLQGCKVKVNGKIVDGVHVSVGGRGGHDPRAAARILEDLPCDELPEVLERLVRFFPRPARAAGAEE
jgi:ferredoxin-nitrite reductase